MPKNEYDSAEYKRARRELLDNKPMCHWCHNREATEADHLVPVQLGGTWRDGMVPSCKSCNASRGAQLINKQTRERLQRRAHASGTPSGGKRSEERASAPAKPPKRKKPFLEDKFPTDRKSVV